MNLGKVLDRSFKILRDNFILIYTIVLVFYFPAFFLNLAVRYMEVQTQMATVGPFLQTTGLLVSFMTIGAFVIVWFFIYPLGIMAVTSAIFNIYTGSKASAVDAYKTALRLYPQALVLNIIVGLLATIGFMLCMIPMVIPLVFFYLVFPVCVVERQGIFASLERSYKLSGNNFFTILIIIFLVSIVKWPVSAACAAVAQSVFSAASLESIFFHALIDFLGVAIVAPVGIVVTAMVYFELREIKEGFDLELMAWHVTENLKL
ncbi:MAG: YciC family protein [Pseudomonadota bacterium]